MALSKESQYEIAINHQHNNPPKPFNTSFNPYHNEAMNTAVKQLSAVGWYENTTLKQRQDTDVLHNLFNKICDEFESGKRYLTKDKQYAKIQRLRLCDDNGSSINNFF